MDVLNNRLKFLSKYHESKDEKCHIDSLRVCLKESDNNNNYYRYDIKFTNSIYTFEFTDIKAEYDEFTVGVFDFDKYEIVKYFTFSTNNNFCFNFITGDNIGNVALCIYAGVQGSTKDKSITIEKINVFKKVLSRKEVDCYFDDSIHEGDIDIDERLDDIIFSYNLDEYYPRYRQVKKAENLMRLMVSKWGEDERIIFISIGDKEYNAGRHLRNQKYLYRLFSEKQAKQVTFVRCDRKGAEYEQIKVYNSGLYDYSRLEYVEWKKFDRVYIMSNSGDNFIGRWLRQHGVSFISLYDYFAINGLREFSSNKLGYYDFIVDKSESCFNLHSFMLDPAIYEFHEQKCKYELHKEEKEWGNFFLKKMIFLLLALRNIKGAKKYIKLLHCIDSDSLRYHEAIDEVCALMREIKHRLQVRTQNDVLALWVDATSAEQVKKMPFLYSLKDRSIWFENIISMNPHTHEVLRTIFLRKKLIDDNTDTIKLITTKNSLLLSDLEQYGYDMKNIGDMYFTKDYLTDKETSFYEAGSTRLWQAIRQILKSNKPCFVLTHLNTEPHEPNLSTLMDDGKLEEVSSRLEYGMQELDEQIRYYTNLLGEKVTSLIFSDHGRENFWPRLHTFMAIYSSRCLPSKIQGICSNFNFSKIVHGIISGEKVTANEICQDWVEIQGNNIRNGDISSIARNRIFPKDARPSLVKSCWGYRGIVNEDYVYVYFSNDREFLISRKEECLYPQWYPREEDCCNPELIPYFRELANTSSGMPVGMLETDYYKSLCKIYQSAYPRNMKKIESIRLLGSYANKAVIYEGDIASREFYYALNADERKNIIGFLDENEMCLCASIGLPVFESYPESEHGVDVIFVTKRNILSDVQAKYGDEVKVIGIYEYFNEKGIDCRSNFWDFELCEEDFEEHL